jgi:ABC-type transporter Mla maintaining outer membrane lipid asymmetry ATPase subunit MlaF
MKTAFHTADQITFLHEGRIYFRGTADELRRATDPVIVDFIEGRSGDPD